LFSTSFFLNSPILYQCFPFCFGDFGQLLLAFLDGRSWAADLKRIR